MKTLKKLINIFFVIFFAFPFGMVYAGGNNIMHIAAPDTHSRGRYYVTERRTPKKVYVEERSEGTNRKTHGAFVERTHFGEYVIYDEPAFPDEFTHVIRAIDADNYLVGVHYPQGQITPILRISRGSGKSLWNIKSCHIFGRVCLSSPEVYIEETPYSEGRMIKSAVDSPDIKAGEVYNFVTPLGSFDEFTDIISFCAAFLFK